MQSLPRSVAIRLLTAGLWATISAWSLAQASLAQTSVRQVKVVESKGAVELEVEASDRIVPQTQVLTGPDRLVIDFPNAVPSKQLFSQSVNRGEVKDVRVGLFQSKPPVTRLVLDLKTAQSYQIFPYGRTVMIKISGAAAAANAPTGGVNLPTQSAARPELLNASYTIGTERIPVNVAVKPALEVSFRDGLLSIHANKATFSEVLFAVQQRTGADIAIPAGAEQERIVADIGPGPVQEVLASLLNGSNFNFLILNSSNDPRRLDRVILSPRNSSFVPPVGPPNADEVSNEEPEPQAEVRPPQPVAVVPPSSRADIPQASPPEEDAPSNQ